MCGLGRSPDNSLMVACGDEVVVEDAHNVVVVDDATVDDDVAAADGVAAVDGVVVAVGVVAIIDVWVQKCWMRACTNSYSHLVSAVVTLRGKKPSWWYRQTTHGPHSTMGRLVCCEPWC